MKRIKQIMMGCIVLGVSCIGSELYATEVSVLPATQTSQKIQSTSTVQKTVTDMKRTTTDGQLTTKATGPSVTVSGQQAVTREVPQAPTPQSVPEVVKEVRITQPVREDKMQTFDQQMNIMGEATVGTTIRIRVYYPGQQALLTDAVEYEEYVLETVGATGMFSQLITLQEGQNDICVLYQYAGEQEVGKLTFTVTRIKASEKEMIKSYMDPQMIVENILPQLSSAKSDITVN